MEPSFNDTTTAFAYKNSNQLRASAFSFWVMNIPGIVPVSNSIVPILLRAGFPLSPFLKPTLFKQFIGGETAEEVAKTLDNLWSYNVRSILDYAAEGLVSDDAFADAERQLIATIDMAAKQKNAAPYISLKFTALAPMDMMERLTAGTATDADRAAKAVLIERLQRISARAAHTGIAYFVDAEETWIQPFIDEVVTQLMAEWNRDKIVVMQTIQCYTVDALPRLTTLLEKARDKGFHAALKIVRGAYLEKERNTAEREQRVSPLHATKEETDACYHRAIDLCFAFLPTTSFMVATHNPKSLAYAMNIMKERGIRVDHPHISFGQLYGMSDNLTMTMAAMGYRSFKYLPYGSFRTVLPYMLRRATENSFIATQGARELALVRSELKRRRSQQPTPASLL